MSESEGDKMSSRRITQLVGGRQWVSIDSYFDMLFLGLSWLYSLRGVAFHISFSFFGSILTFTDHGFYMF
jgi:hypothetical protein